MPNMDIIGSVKSSLTEPKKYLATLVNRKSLTEAYILYLILSAITTIIYIPYLYLDYSQKFSEQSTVLAWVIGMTLFMVVYSLGGIFITIGIHHLFLKLFGAKGRFVDTFNSNIYSFITSFLFSIIYIIIFFFMKLAVPDIKTGALSSIILYFSVFGILTLITVGVLIYCWYLYCYALSLVHKISKGRAFVAALVIPTAILTVLIIILVVLFILIFGMAISSGLN